MPDKTTQPQPRIPQGARLLAALFWNSLLFSLTASNGYAIIASMKERYVRRDHWLDEETMSDYTALAQSTPGPIAVSGAFIVGHRLGGPAGALVSVLGIVIPPVVMMTAVFYAYDFVATNPYIRRMFLGMQAAVCAFIISSAYDSIRDITKRDGRAFLMCVFIAAFVAMKAFGASVLLTMVAAAIAAVLYFRIRPYGKKDEGIAGDGDADGGKEDADA